MLWFLRYWRYLFVEINTFFYKILQLLVILCEYGVTTTATICCVCGVWGNAGTEAKTKQNWGAVLLSLLLILKTFGHLEKMSWWIIQLRQEG